ncbi:MAG: polysaccharide biosynthesis/export family protein [Acidobacteriota bacterium]
MKQRVLSSLLLPWVLVLAALLLGLWAPVADVMAQAVPMLTADLTPLLPVTDSAPAEAAGPARKPELEEYVLGAEDLLDVQVVGVDALSRTVRIAQSGNITLPLLGTIQVQGLTRTDLEQSIASSLAEKYVNDPQVSVFVKEYGSRMVSVLGAVRQPGRYPMVGRRTLLDMVSDAGGLTEEAGPVAIITHRAASGKTDPSSTQVDLKALLYGGRADLNHLILPGDLVHVPVDRPVKIYVNGAVKTPGELEARLSQPLTVLQAITKAGGATQRAALKKIEILRRRQDGGQQVIPVNLKAIRKGRAEDLILQDGDVVVVPETYF